MVLITGRWVRYLDYTDVNFRRVGAMASSDAPAGEYRVCVCTCGGTVLVGDEAPFRQPAIPKARHSDNKKVRHSDSPPFRKSGIPKKGSAIPNVRYSEIPLFRNPGIPNVRYSEIPLFRNWLLRQFCPWILHQVPTSSTSNERWESPLHHPIMYSLFFFQ